jgi:hypothetical protein
MLPSARQLARFTACEIAEYSNNGIALLSSLLIRNVRKLDVLCLELDLQRIRLFLVMRCGVTSRADLCSVISIPKNLLQGVS